MFDGCTILDYLWELTGNVTPFFYVLLPLLIADDIYKSEDCAKFLV